VLKVGGWKQRSVPAVKNLIVAKSKGRKMWPNLVESCKEGCGSKRALSPMMMKCPKLISRGLLNQMPRISFW
jgi:hypothetical protein